MLELKNICWVAPDGKQILNNINLKIDDDKLIAITGPNGSGKTTLAKIIMGIETPTSGQILLDGQDITNVDITDRAKMGVSFAFQQPVRFKGITVKNLLETAAGKKLDKKDICNILQKIGLCAEEYLERDIDDTLSGGEIKRIEIASVLARHTKLTVFDEPEAGIDLWSFKNLIEVFNEMHKDLKGTLVIISHQERILNIADEIVVIADGMVKEQGPGAGMVKRMLMQERNGELCCVKKEVFNG